MTERGASELKVGVGVGLALLLFVITVILLGGDKSFLSSSTTLKVSFDKIDGIAPGSLVRLSGFQVGNVSDIEFSEADSRLIVYLKILKKYQSRVTKDSIAGLRTQGALGDKYVYITAGAPGGEPLNDGDFLATESSADLLTTLTQRGDEINRVFDILKELDTFTKSLNKAERTDKTMANITKASEELKLLLEDLRGEDKKNIKKISKHLASILEKIDNGGGTLGALINDSTLHDKIKAMLGGSKRNDYMKSLIQQTVQEGKK